mmetsp:Transcript_21680/g.51823  ORF Transcript_21680/g.51823 Transcript_21680/m.51823 type:complete len:229 (+) Transcript_21680:186-872(+)
MPAGAEGFGRGASVSLAESEPRHAGRHLPLLPEDTSADGLRARRFFLLLLVGRRVPPFRCPRSRGASAADPRPRPCECLGPLRFRLGVGLRLSSELLLLLPLLPDEAPELPLSDASDADDRLDPEASEESADSEPEELEPEEALPLSEEELVWLEPFVPVEDVSPSEEEDTEGERFRFFFFFFSFSELPGSCIPSPLPLSSLSSSSGSRKRCFTLGFLSCCVRVGRDT